MGRGIFNTDKYIFFFLQIMNWNQFQNIYGKNKKLNIETRHRLLIYEVLVLWAWYSYSKMVQWGHYILDRGFILTVFCCCLYELEKGKLNIMPVFNMCIDIEVLYPCCKMCVWCVCVCVFVYCYVIIIIKKSIDKSCVSIPSFLYLT